MSYRVICVSDKNVGVTLKHFSHFLFSSVGSDDIKNKEVMKPILVNVLAEGRRSKSLIRIFLSVSVLNKVAVFVLFKAFVVFVHNFRV